MSYRQRLTTRDIEALSALAAGEDDINHVSRYWLFIYQLIDEGPRGWRITARGRDYLTRLAAQKTAPQGRAESPAPDRQR